MDDQKTISQCITAARFPGIDTFVDLAGEMHALIGESRYASSGTGQFLSWVLDELTVRVDQVKAHPDELERLPGVANLAYLAAALAQGGVAPELLPWEAETCEDFIAEDAEDDETRFENALRERERTVERCYERCFRGDGDADARLFLRGYLEALADIQRWMTSGPQRPVEALRRVFQREMRR